MDGEAGWWTTSGNIGLPPLARAMGVGRQHVMQLLSSGNNTVDMVYLDFAKAFDKVDHGVLLHKIKTLGITGKLGVWLYHFLTCRTQFVRLQGGVSFDSPVISGVPQGTVLGPLLFIILMCDINNSF